MLRIREMKYSDLAEVALLEKQIFSSPWSEQALRETLSRKDTIYLTAEQDTKIAGYCGLYNIAGEGEVLNVAVRDTFRRQGIAFKMLAELLNRGNQAGVSSFTLEVRKSNLPAIHLYESLGFAAEGIRPGFYDRPREDAVIMWRR